MNKSELKQLIKEITIQEISVSKPEIPFKVKLKTIGIDKSSLDVDGIDWSDYPDFVDAYIVSAKWNNGSNLTDDELNELNDMDEYIYNMLARS